MRIYPFVEFKHKLTFGPFDVAAPEVVATDIGAALLKLHMRAVKQETSNGKGMYKEYKRTENNDETDEIRSDARV